MSDHDWCHMKRSQVRNFWAHYLTSPGFDVRPALRRILEVTLSLPIGSADAERAFSIMAHIRNKRRARLNPNSLDAIMRIWMNGPKKLEEFNAARYSKAWLDAGHFRSDSNKRTQQQKITLLDTDK